MTEIACAAYCSVMNDRDSVRPQHASEPLRITFALGAINVNEYVEAPDRIDRKIRHIRQVASRSDGESCAGIVAEAISAMRDACR
jgi:hypothetical protein